MIFFACPDTQTVLGPQQTQPGGDEICLPQGQFD